MKLKNAIVGQRVELKVKHDGLDAGATGTIVRICTTQQPCIGVQWDDLTTGHSCSGTTTRSSSGWYVNIEDLRKLKEPKTTEITVGSRVRITGLRGLDGSEYGVRVGDVYTVTQVDCDGDVKVNLRDGRERYMFTDQIQLVK